MDRRLQLQTVLETLLGTREVFFQPPPSKRLTDFPCLVYQRDDEWKVFAGNRPYSSMLRYQVTLIAQKPDTDIREKLVALPRSSFERFYAANNLNHDVFTLYY